MLRVTHIVPALPPAVNGLGDYAYILAQELRTVGVDSRFIVAGMPPAPADSFEVGDFPVGVLREQRAEALVACLASADIDIVLLHFVGYAYAHWGLCHWLVEGFREWKGRTPSRYRLITMFHELYAFGPPWRAGFWTSVPQRRIARTLALMSDAVVCSHSLNEQKLCSWRQKPGAQRIAVFSNVGELIEPPPLASREAVAVVFGSVKPRLQTFESLTKYPRALGDLDIREILDIGPAADVPSRLGDVPVRSLGILPAAGVSAIFARAKVGVVDYPLHVIAKSGILAAYHAHGLLCVNVSTRGRLCNDVADGVHFVGRNTLRMNRFNAEAIAWRGHQWYRGHDRRRTAQLFAQVIRETGA